MESKEKYVEKMSGQLKQLASKIDEMEVQANLAKAEAKEKYQRQISDLRSKKAEAEQKLNEVRSKGEEAWQDLKTGIDSAVDDMLGAVESALDKVKSK